MVTKQERERERECHWFCHLPSFYYLQVSEIDFEALWFTDAVIYCPFIYTGV